MIRVGTCAFTDHQGLYPRGTRPAERLALYAREFDVVEVDAPFYRAPRPDVADRWLSQVPPDFVFDVKAPGSLTGHRPQDPDEAARFRDLLQRLAAGGRLGAVLLQWPPWHRDTPDARRATANAVAALAPFPTAVEFRRREWYRDADALTAWLRSLGAAQVVVDAPAALPTAPPWQPALADPHLAYVRFHGRNRETWSQPGLASSQDRFRYRYGADELAARVPDLVALEAAGAEVHVLMNNNYGSHAVDGARWFRDRLAPRPGTQTQFDW
jgi:uncharacterized protein YecE (DUF72 family)